MKKRKQQPKLLSVRSVSSCYSARAIWTLVRRGYFEWIHFCVGFFESLFRLEIVNILQFKLTEYLCSRPMLKRPADNSAIRFWPSIVSTDSSNVWNWPQNSHTHTHANTDTFFWICSLKCRVQSQSKIVFKTICMV